MWKQENVTTMTELFDVVIVDKESRVVSHIAGRDLRLHDGTGTGRGTAELRQQMLMDRINDDYECVIVPAGSFEVGVKYNKEVT